MLFCKYTLYVVGALYSLAQVAHGIEVTRNVVFSDSLIDTDVIVDTGFGVSFLSQGSVPISMDGDITNNGVFCLGLTKFGTISSDSITNNGQMFLQTENFAGSKDFQATNLLNNGFLSFTRNSFGSISITGSFINKGVVYINYPSDSVVLEGPTGGIVNDGVIEVYGGLTPYNISFSNIVGTGCTYLDDSYRYLQLFDLSKPFNQTIYAKTSFAQLSFTGPQLAESIPVIRLPPDSFAYLLVGPQLSEYPTYTYNNVTGMLNLTVPTGSFIFDVGPNLAQYYEAICNTDKVATPCMQIKSNSNAEMPSNCQASIDVDKVTTNLCPIQKALPAPLTTKASYQSNTITKIVSYETTLDTDGLPSTLITTEYFIPSFSLPSPYTTTITNGLLTQTEVVSYFTTTGYLPNLPELTTLPYLGTTTSTISVPFLIPHPYTSTFTDLNMTVSEIISYYSTTGSDGKPATGTTTSTLTATSYITTTTTDYPMGTTHITKDYTSEGTWSSSVTYSTAVETYIIKILSTGTGIETLSTIY
ncbi:hypothetical protein NCAS_0E03100 [Naumovozyma castellii]|uniref:Hyphally-regulated cell wall protein N-terminal domain-containing protein n=1 Tax=Naumovozyma castellii TaxID=27288 RepID=G0VFW1_NAUCA|nr:hypothetical protein NCAS_0E03100 [Naumovozyma castellii CBS 4309]CCC70380.1 hypothetical protein NCAS_0E03100 [Naumovozyma castellii CBS 4309]